MVVQQEMEKEIDKKRMEKNKEKEESDKKADAQDPFNSVLKELQLDLGNLK